MECLKNSKNICMTDSVIHYKNIDLASIKFYPQQEKPTMTIYYVDKYILIMICNDIQYL